MKLLRSNPRLVASFVALVLIAAIYLPFPLKGDQAMFLYGAHEMANGARLYVDFWDMKQPGIFWFYQAAGELVRFDQIGVRTLELLWALALAVLLTIWMAPELRQQALVPWVSLYSVGIAYGATYWDTVYGGQVEFLVALPIAATLFFLLRKTGSIAARTRLDILAGVCVAIVVIFKLVLALIPAALIALIVLRAITAERQSAADVLVQRLLPIAAGFCGCIALAAGYFWAQGSLSEAWWANLVYPRLAIEEFPHAPLWRMRASIETFLIAMWPLLPLVVIGVIGGLRRRSFYVLALLVWIVAAALAVLIQVLSWWLYHFALFVIPFGLLALFGIDSCLTWLARKEIRATVRRTVAVLLCAVPLLVGVLVPALHHFSRVWLSGPPPWKNLYAFADRADRIVASLRKGAAFLNEPTAHPGAIGVLGDPRMVAVSGRRPVPEINGWTYFLPSQLAQEAEDLRQARPPYVYVSRYLAHLHTNGTPVLYQTLDELYRLRSTDEANGAWYVRRDLVD